MSRRDELAQLATSVREASEGTPEREARLQRLAALIREGKYHVDTNALARKIIEAERWKSDPSEVE